MSLRQSQSHERKAQHDLPDPYAEYDRPPDPYAEYDEPVSRLPPSVPPHRLPTAPNSPSPSSLVDPYACYSEELSEVELKDAGCPPISSHQRGPPLPPHPARAAKPTQSLSPQVLRGLDAGQAQARQLTADACAMRFRIHDVVIEMEPCAFDDLPEMTTWLNRGLFLRGEFIRDSALRVLVSLHALMQSRYRELFLSWAHEMRVYHETKSKGGGGSGLFSSSVVVPEMRFFYYADNIGILYERAIVQRQRAWCCNQQTPSVL